MALAELTKPFTIIHNEPTFVKDKYLEGVPWKNEFPGPFEGVTPEQQMMYANQQHNAVLNYNNISEKPLHDQAIKYNYFNAGLPNCESYGSEVPMVPPVQTKYRGPPQLTPQGIRLPMEESQNRIEDFKDNSITDPCNQTGFGSIVPKFNVMPKGINDWAPNESSVFPKCTSENNPLTDIENRPVEQFSHNNMVPFYGAKLTQNMNSTGVPQAGDNNTCDAVRNGFADVTPWRDKLQTFTGCDEMYMHKREVGPMFSPAEQQTGWVFGTPAFRPDMDRYKESIYLRNNEAPVEKINVGPGIGLAYTVPAQGGFQQYTRILPNNVNDYKANQLEGRVNAGKWVLAEHPTSQYIEGVPNNKAVDLYITQARRPTMRTKFYNNSPSADDSRITNFTATVNRGKQARTDTEQGAGFGQLNFNGSKIENFTDENTNGCITFGQAPVGRIMKSLVPAQPNNLSSYNTIRETFKRGAAGFKDGKYWECEDRTQGQNRWDLFGPAKGSVPDQGPREGWYANFTDRGDINPFVINVTGTASKKGGVWNPNNFQDQQRVTMKETTTFSYNGNPTGSTNKPYENTWSDNPKVTKKETTEYAYNGNPTGSTNKPYENTWSDLPKVSRKETTGYSYAGNTKSGIPDITNRFMYDGNFH
jgi:hypothetical protein